MASYVDFQELKARATIQQVLDMLEVKNLKRHGDTLRGHCPCCKEGNDRAFVVTPAKNIYYCFAEKKSGDIIELASRFWRIPQREAAGRIAKHFGAPEPGGDRPAEPAETTPRSGFDAKAYQASLEPGHPGLRECGISEQTIRAFGGGHCSRGVHRGRLVVPIYTFGGDILGFMGLALKGEDPDTLFPKGFAPPPWFNVHRVGSGPLYLVQHPRDVVRVADAGMENVICPLLPMTPDMLESLAAIMRERRSDTLEVY